MKVSELKYEDLTDEYVDKILFENIKDDGVKGDCILVFGSIKANQYRVPKAKLFFLGVKVLKQVKDIC